MNANTKTKSNTLKLPKAYWALYHGELVIAQGTHTEVWQQLMSQYATFTVAELQKANVRIARMN